MTGASDTNQEPMIFDAEFFGIIGLVIIASTLITALHAAGIVGEQGSVELAIVAALVIGFGIFAKDVWEVKSDR